jgi:hypothetical protein
LRVRILKAVEGIMDGQSLSPYLPGYIYDVDEALGRTLIAMGVAIEVRSTDPAVDSDPDDIDMARLTGGVHVIPPDKADDRIWLRPKPDRRRASDRRKKTRNERRR